MAKFVVAIVEMEGEDAGKVALEAQGYQGVGCAATLAKFTDGLAGEVTHVQRKPEFNAKVTKANCVTR